MKLHIEPTSRCVLECPGCPRTQFRDIVKRPVNKTDLNVDDLERFLDCPGGKEITHFILCGDYGDTIYYPDLFKLIDRFRDSKTFNIVTNGSYRNQEFWNQLAASLTSGDTITFSIDGLEDTNHLYRKNADWTSIMLGLDTIVKKSQATVHWKTIVFNYNVGQLEQIKNFAINKGATFSAEKTHRFGDNSLMPVEDLVETNHLYQERFSNDHSIRIQPRCESERVITSDGYFYPCDWIRNPRTLYKSQLWKQKDRWINKLDIKSCNFDQGMAIVKDWANFVRQNSIEQNNQVDVLCRMKCREGCQQNKFLDI